MKGQYFSFDAIIATVIMVLAITSLVAYWFGIQAVIESRTSPLYSDSLRIAESLLSSGVPSDWVAHARAGEWGQINQFGLANGFSGELNRTKIETLAAAAGRGSPGPEYSRISAMLRADGYKENYYILIERADDPSDTSMQFMIGKAYPANASEVAVANRGGTLDGAPMRLRVYLWRE